MEQKKDDAMDHDLQSQRIGGYVKWLNSEYGPEDAYYLMIPSQRQFQREMGSMGDKGFLIFMLDRLKETLSGLPVPVELLMHHQKNCETFAKVDKQAGYPVRWIDHMEYNGLQFKHLITTESAAYCILHDIPLLAAASDTAIFSQRNGFQKEIADITGSFPVLKEKIEILRRKTIEKMPQPGSIYIIYDSNLNPQRVSTDGKSDKDFKAFIYNELHRVEQGKPLPENMIIRFDVPDIAPFQFVSGENIDEYHRRKLVPCLKRQFIKLPAYSLHLLDAVYSVQNGIPLLSPAAEQQSERPNYFNACYDLCNSAPDLSRKLDQLQRLDGLPKPQRGPKL